LLLVCAHAAGADLGVRVAFALRAGNPMQQHLFCVLIPRGLYEGLRGHEVPCGVIGVGGEQVLELVVGAVKFSGIGVFHGQAVARKSIVGIMGKQFGQHGDSVHSLILLDSTVIGQGSNCEYNRANSSFPE
jgi:hypothetical protein